jgi:dienelactone hydrolase
MSNAKTPTNEERISSDNIPQDPAEGTPSYEAFFVPPAQAERGNGVMVLPSKWGVTSSVKNYCYELSDLGYSVIAPQVLQGPLPLEERTADELLEQADPNLMVDAVRSSLHALRSYSLDPKKPVTIIGFGMGASLAIWASERLFDSVNLCVAYYGSQDINFEDSQSEYLLNFAKDDEYTSEDDANFCYSNLKVSGKEAEVHWFDAKHDFMEKELPNYNQAAATQAWQDTLTIVQRVNS